MFTSLKVVCLQATNLTTTSPAAFPRARRRNSVDVDAGRSPLPLSEADAAAALEGALELLSSADEITEAVLQSVLVAAKAVIGGSGAAIVEKVGEGTGVGGEEEGEPTSDAEGASALFARVLAASEGGVISRSALMSGVPLSHQTIAAGVGPLWKCWVRPEAPPPPEEEEEENDNEEAEQEEGGEEKQRKGRAPPPPPPELPLAVIPQVLTDASALACLEALSVIPRPGALVAAPLEYGTTLYEGAITAAAESAAAAAEAEASAEEEEEEEQAEGEEAEEEEGKPNKSKAKGKMPAADAAQPAIPSPVLKPRFLAIVVDTLTSAVPTAIDEGGVLKLKQLATALGHALARTETAHFSLEYKASKAAEAEGGAKATMAAEAAAEKGEWSTRKQGAMGCAL